MQNTERIEPTHEPKKIPVKESQKPMDAQKLMEIEQPDDYEPRRIPVKESYWIEDLVNSANAKQKQQQTQPARPPRKLRLTRMMDSYVEELLPFKTDSEVLEEYIDPYGGIRMGKLFEDMDLLAANIGYRHCRADKEDLTIVTASIDRIDLIKPVPISDIRISGHITYAGYSSMEVTVTMEALKDGIFSSLQTSTDINETSRHSIPPGDPLIIARFNMVARDPATNRSVQVNPLQIENESQKKLFQIAEENKARKSASAAAALTKLPPTEEEKLLIHDLYLENSKYANRREEVPQNLVWMDETVMESVTYMQPQQRNLHSYIFGGYLLKLAYELSMSNASVFFKNKATFLSLDEVSFRRPVPVGSIVVMHSQIVYAPGSPCKTIQIAVSADVLDVKREKRDTTNVFYFTFKCSDPSVNVRRVIPKTYNEAIKFAEGKRRQQISLRETSTNDKRIKMISRL